MVEAHEMLKLTYEESKLAPILPNRGMGLFMEAMPMGSVVLQDTRSYGILQGAKTHRKMCEGTKIQENRMSAMDSRLERQKIRILPNWKRKVFHDIKQGTQVGKIAAAVAVYIQYRLREDRHEVKLKTVGELYAIGQHQIRKVVTGKRYGMTGVVSRVNL